MAQSSNESFLKRVTQAGFQYVIIIKILNDDWEPLYMTETTVLYRPTGSKELDLIRESGYTAFPPRLFWQPIFYPVLNEEYATQIARDWNARDGDSGYVTRFYVQTSFLCRYEVQQVGSAL